ncbi:hypothetical protein N7463_001604 [Penicillium fimorum]|uniref:Protein kinase domain-containing protein n=1 Tax=Penicillium fimorum TaxID=1882269 RepID=A0A9W9XXK7_9EURO|nr:hypothetical protein N7463_001604 [Penicillium fimorum]
MVVLKIYVVDHMLKTYGRVHPPKPYEQSKCPLHEVSDRFSIKSPRGLHICVVHEGPPIDPEQMHPVDKMNLESMRSTMKQMLVMMDFLHTDCYLTARIRPNETFNLASDHRRGAGPSNVELITPTILPEDGVPLRLDFPDNDMPGIIEKHSRPPEQVLKSKCDHRADIWGTAVAFPRTHRRTKLGRSLDDRVHVAELVALLGTPPPEFHRNLESLAAGNVEGEDVEGFMQWMRKALQLDPEDRPMALGLLRHDWMARKTKPVEGEGADVPEESTEV